ncbi:hypothetical protein PF008_g12026 [Phytophthora fragariae]|uniref:Uncharacterized protein n=1 Tax=Phytophthora fragariae TaxID=53985 RepID=A0A6G0RQ02_9STRA|nr:hypothetical protein PF008_g12026 [Phytophthora fragariae]
MEVLTGVRPKLDNVVVFGSSCTEFRDPGKKAWQPRAEVGMIVGKNDEMNRFKVYLPKSRVVITTQHVRKPNMCENMETLNVEQNSKPQEQLLREDPGLSRAIAARDVIAQQRETNPDAIDSPVSSKKLKNGNKKKK